MKIFILPIPEHLRPRSQMFKYPNHNKDYGVEQDFYSYLYRNNGLLTDDPQNSDWHYLPVFWTRWHINHGYAKQGLDDLKDVINNCILDDQKTFTICQYDDGPLIELGKSLVFLSSRKTGEGVDIPLISSPHRIPWKKPQKRYLASVIGRLNTHPIRQEMARSLEERTDIIIKDGNYGTRFFKSNILRSYVSLSPRGYGGSSFRFFESMQMGVSPFLISDLDTRPFKSKIQWDSMTFYTESANNIATILDSCSIANLLERGVNCKFFFEEYLGYQKWCKLVIDELEERKIS